MSKRFSISGPVAVTFLEPGEVFAINVFSREGAQVGMHPVTLDEARELFVLLVDALDIAAQAAGERSAVYPAVADEKGGLLLF